MEGRKMKRTGILLGAVLLLAGYAVLQTNAGQLDPPGPVAPSMHDLAEIGALGDAASLLVFDDQLGGFADLRSEAYIKIEVGGEWLEGDVQTGEHSNWSRVFGVDFHVFYPRDPGTFGTTGGHRYEPLIVRMNVEKNWPLIYKALVENETVTSARLEWVRPDVLAPFPYYTVEMTNGRIVNAALKLVPTPNGQVHVLEVSFVFSTIELESLLSPSVSWLDDWTATP